MMTLYAGQGKSLTVVCQHGMGLRLSLSLSLSLSTICAKLRGKPCDLFLGFRGSYDF